MRGMGLHMGLSRSNRFNPAILFGTSTAGAFYDSSDISSMYQDSAGTTAAVVDQPVGLLLDKRFGLARGAALASGSWTAQGATITGTDAAPITTTAAGAGGGYRDIVTTIGAWYSLAADWSGSVASSIQIYEGGAFTTQLSASATLASNAGHALLFKATTATTRVYLRNGGAGTVNWSNLLIQALPGNHAIQATAAARPILRRDGGGYYYLEFDGVDDEMRVAFAIAQPWDRISAIRQISSTNDERIFGGVAANSGNLNQATAPSLYLASGGASAAVAGPAVGSSGVVTERHNGATSLLGLNGNTPTTVNAGTTATDGLTLGSAGAAVPGRNGHIRLYGLIMIGRALTDAETVLARQWAARGAGVVL